MTTRRAERLATDDSHNVRHGPEEDSVAARVYLDHAATMPLRPEVLAFLRQIWTEPTYNASAAYAEGRAASRRLEEARARVAHCIGAGVDEVYFTSGGTESDNWALKGSARHIIDKCRDRASLARSEGSSAGGLDMPLRFLAAKIEHHAVLRSLKALENSGAALSWIPVTREGRIELAALREALRQPTFLFTLMLANNETGAVQPVKEACTLVKQAGEKVICHCDAVAAAGHLPLDVNELGVDLLSLSGHKFGAPAGVGVLYKRRACRLAPLLDGGSQERGLRAGTEAIAAAEALALALEIAESKREEENARCLNLRLFLEAQLRKNFAPSDLRFVDPGEPRLPGTLIFLLPGSPSDDVLRRLDTVGFALSAGAACSAGEAEPSHVLRAMGYGYDESQCALRVSLGAENTEAELLALCGALKRIITED